MGDWLQGGTNAPRFLRCGYSEMWGRKWCSSKSKAGYELRLTGLVAQSWGKQHYEKRYCSRFTSFPRSFLLVASWIGCHKQHTLD